jgi:copper binding plastocyanin/azurin family protein
MNTPRYFVLACLVLAAGCGSSGGGGGTDPGGNGGGGGGGNPPAACVPGAGTVCLTTSNQFNPATATIAPGSSITFNNTSGTTHNVTFTTTGAPGNVPDFSSGTKVVTFAAPGTYNYHCTIHGLSMSGVVVVQ